MKKILLYLFLVGITLLILLNPQQTIINASASLKLCWEIIVPSLFPFFVSSGLLIYSGFLGSISKIFRPVMKPLFNVNASGSIAFILGIISGYPLGALTACQLYEGGYLTKEEAERVLSFCNNSGPLFILASVGVSLFHSLRLGMIIYISHLFSALTVGIIMRNYKKRYFTPTTSVPSPHQENIGKIFSQVISNSINSILTVCGVIVFCSVISRAILEFLPARGLVYSLVLGGMEFVNGISDLSTLPIPLILKLMFSSWIVGFAGFSVHLQVIAIVSKYNLSLIPYILGKILQGAISAIYTVLIYRLTNPSLTAFSNNTISYSAFTSSFFVIITVLFVITLSVIPPLFTLIKKGIKKPSR